jgi:hypothetical protein
MPTNGAGQGLLAEDWDVTPTLTHYDRPSPWSWGRVTSADFVSRYNEVKTGEIRRWRQEAVRWVLLAHVVNSRARALFHSRKRPSLVGTFPGKKSQHSRSRHASAGLGEVATHLFV